MAIDFSTVAPISIDEFATITFEASARLAVTCAETMKMLVADPAGPGYATFYNVTLHLRNSKTVAAPLIHEQVRSACYVAADNGLMAPLERVQDDGSITGVSVNPPLVWFDPANPPEVVQKLLGIWVDPNAVDPNAAPTAAVDPNTVANATLVGVVYTTSIPLGNITSIE